MIAGLQLLPAVDVASGRAVQVVGAGEHDPYAVALGWVHAGASWVHLVDLDRAFGRGDNTALLAEVVATLAVPVQLSGGLADAAALDWALGTGARRIVLSSAALAERDWLREVAAVHAGRVALGVDVRDGEVVARGTPRSLGPLPEVLEFVATLPDLTVVLADASRDGTRHGADAGLFARVVSALPNPVIASGGVASLQDVRRLRSLGGQGLHGVVLGSALYHGAFTLAEALDVAGEPAPELT